MIARRWSNDQCNRKFPYRDKPRTSWLHISRERWCPSKKKVETSLQRKAPTPRKQVRRFLGMLHYYVVTIITPTGSIVINDNNQRKWKWAPSYQGSFDQMTGVIAKGRLVMSQKFTKECEIHTDASKLQCGACISQEGKPPHFMQDIAENCSLLRWSTNNRMRAIVRSTNTERIQKHLIETKIKYIQIMKIECTKHSALIESWKRDYTLKSILQSYNICTISCNTKTNYRRM